MRDELKIDLNCPRCEWVSAYGSGLGREEIIPFYYPPERTGANASGFPYGGGTSLATGEKS